MAVLEVEGLEVDLRPGLKADPTHVVRGVSFALESGRRLGLVGESGCGKTTTLMAVAGLLAPTATVGGRVRICGAEQFETSKDTLTALRRRDIGFVFQGSMNALNPVRRIGRQLREALRDEVRDDRAFADQRCAELLERVGLPAKVARQYPHELSGGMRQRVCIAIALAGEPKLLLADEPTTALDTVVQARIVELLDQLCAELELSVVIVSHDLRLASEFCDVIAVMYAGVIVECRSAAELIAAPRHPYTRMLFAATPTITSNKAEIVSIPGAPPDLRRAIEGCPFAARCPDRAAICSTPPPPVTTETGFAACHFA
jgi:oligopeptide/dipeptide ABC transporter ATP-binding protein